MHLKPAATAALFASIFAAAGTSAQHNANATENALAPASTASATVTHVEPKTETVVIGACDSHAWSTLFRGVAFNKLMKLPSAMNITRIGPNEIEISDYTKPADLAARQHLADSISAIHKITPTASNNAAATRNNTSIEVERSIVRYTCQP